MYFVAKNAPPEDYAIAELINKGLDSRQLFKAAFSFHQVVLGSRIASEGQTTIQNGLFKGTIINPESFSSQFLPKFIGTYECEVQNHLISINTPIDCFLNIGCADGFYVACIARWLRIPCIGVDIDPRSAAAIANVSQANGVGDLVSFSKSTSEAARQLSGSVLILIDVDGAELKVLSELLEALEKNPLIKHVHLILETDLDAKGDMNHPALIHSLSSKDWIIDRLIQQDHSQHFLHRHSHLSFLDQVVMAAEGRHGGQIWIAAQRAYNSQ